MSENELSSMSAEELAALADKAKAALQEKLESGRSEVIKEIHRLAASIGVSVVIANGSEPKSNGNGAKHDGRAKVAIKYRDEDGNTWTGRGRTPLWVHKHLQQGRMLESFRIS
jgi:DNA-binding protein H-NS